MRRRSDGGFTLLELLVSLALVALIVTTLLGGLHIGRRAWESGRMRDTAGEVDAATRALSGLLSQAFPAASARAGSAAFEGGEDGCRFVMLSDGEGQWAGLIAVELGLRPGRRGLELRAATKVYRPNAQNREAPRETVLLSDVAYVRMSYFGVSEYAAEPSWRPVWNNVERLPQLVMMRIGVRRSGSIIETALTARVRQG